MRRERMGFTLIELLVVVSILALLVAILAPSLGRAMELARRAVCASRQHEMGKGFAIWADGHSGELPKATVNIDWPAGNRWPCRAFWHGFGVNDTYQAHARGECALARAGFIDPKSLYCPSWNHPWMQLGQVDPAKPQYTGYFPEAEGIAREIKHMYGSYHYRATFRGSPFRPASLKVDSASDAVLVDKFMDGDVAMHHGDGYVVLYLDGHSRWLPDPGHVVRDWNSGYDYSSNLNLQELIFKDFFSVN